MSKTPRKTKGTPDPIDMHVGQRLRVRRSLLGMSQEKLAGSIGLTFQQIQKYERGTNRISAGRLYQFSKILEVPIAYFYEQFSDIDVAALPERVYGVADNTQDPFDGPPRSGASGYKEDFMDRKETLELIRSYYSIRNTKVRKDALKLLKSIAQTPPAFAEGEEE